MDRRDNAKPSRNVVDSPNEGNANREGQGKGQNRSDYQEHLFTSSPCEPRLSNNGHLRFYSSPHNQQISPLTSEPGNNLYKNSSSTSSDMCKANSNHSGQPEATGCRQASASDAGLESNEQSCQRTSGCQAIVRTAYNGPSTSGTSNNGSTQNDNSVPKENRKRPACLRLNRPNFEEDSSSDTGNEDYSLGSEDGCIYTYRGGEHLADLPSSFFSLDMGLPLDRHLPIPPNYVVRAEGQQNVRPRSRASSPDMDFLEMDFDPGPSCDADDGDESSPDIDLDDGNDMLIEEEIVVVRGTTPDCSLQPVKPETQPIDAPKASTSSATHDFDMPSTSTSYGKVKEIEEKEEASSNSVTCSPYITHVNARGEQLLVRRTMSQTMSHTAGYLHATSGDLVSPREVLNHEEDQSEHFAYQINQGEHPQFDPVNLSTALYHINMAKRLMTEKSQADSEGNQANMASGDACQPSADPPGVSPPPRSMVWSEREACERQVTQIGTSACGATAVVNVFIALGVPVNIESINAAVGTRQRANNAPLPRYLLSRAVAGCSAADLVSALQRASEGRVTARFFPTHPERAMSLSHWLADWISLGAVPILTLNLQVGSDSTEIPDAWHHQMVFGVSSRGVYLCNPVECVPESVLWPRLTSPSVLLVRTRDVLSRYSPRTDLTPLMAVPDRRFHTFNVLGQVVNLVREWQASGWNEAGIRTRHVRLPACYQAGATVAALTGSEAHRRLMHATPPPPVP